MNDRSVWDVPTWNMALKRRCVFEHFVKVRDPKQRNFAQKQYVIVTDTYLLDHFVRVSRICWVP